VIATEWPEFKELDSAVARPVMAVPLVIDGRHLFDPAVMRDLRFHYEPVGSPATKAVPSR
jgi:UDPglucose 6-dehydrogenase